MTSVKCHDSPMVYTSLFSQFFRWWVWGTERWNNLTKIHSNWQSRDLSNDNLTSEPVLLSTTHQGNRIKYILWENHHVQCWNFIDKDLVGKQLRIWWKSHVSNPCSYPYFSFFPFLSSVLMISCVNFILWTET